MKLHTKKKKKIKNCSHMKTRGAKPLEPHKASTPWETCEQAREH